jgi:membrane protein required for colicin V production
MNLPSFNVLDGLIVITLGWNFIRGFNKGFTEEILSLIGIVMSLFLAFNLSHHLAGLLLSTKHPDSTTVAIVGSGIYFVSFLVFKYFAFSINRQLRKTPFGMLNNLLGFLFGIFRGIAIASIFVLGIAFIAPESYLIKKSYLGGLTVPVIDPVIDKALAFMPKKNRKQLENNWKIARSYLIKNLEEWKNEKG